MIIQVYHDKKVKSKNSWKWRVAIVAKGKKTGNVLYHASGYNTRQGAAKQARAHNKKLIKPLLIETLL